MRTAVVSAQGRRAQMEDAHFLDADFGGRGWVYGGVYDGHGGSFAAEYSAYHLHQRFLEKLLAGVAPENAFTQAYEAVSAEMAGQDSGTTAVDFLIADNDIIAANAGDARAIVVARTSVVQLTIDDRIENEAERERIERSGGRIFSPYVYRGNAGLMPTRSIGDAYFKAVGVIATPHVRRYHIGSDDMVLVAACDGIFDFMANNEVADIARRFEAPDELAESLRKEVLENRRGSDNITVMCVRLHDDNS